jgi:hypothetical protein
MRPFPLLSHVVTPGAVVHALPPENAIRLESGPTARRADDLKRWSRLRRAGRALVAVLFVAALTVVVFKKPPPVEGPAEREASVAKHVKR